MAGYEVNPKGGDEKNPQGIGEEIHRHPCLLGPSDPLTDFGRIAVKPGSVCFFVWAYESLES